MGIMVWRSLHHKEILLSEPGRNTNVGENAFIPELPLFNNNHNRILEHE